MALLASTMAVSCDQDAQAAFRQTATADIGQGIKEFLSGSPEQATTTIMNAAVDGVVAGIQQAGRGSSSAK